MNESNLLVKTIIFYDDELKEFLFELESILTIQLIRRNNFESLIVFKNFSFISSHLIFFD
jgi:hypothetical protein